MLIGSTLFRKLVGLQRSHTQAVTPRTHLVSIGDGKDVFLQTTVLRFGEVDLKKLNPTDQKIWSVFDRFQKLLTPPLSEKDQQRVNNIKKAYSTKEKQFKLIDELVIQPDFPWDQLPSVRRVILEEFGKKDPYSYALFPKNSNFKRLYFVDREVKRNGKRVFQDRLINAFNSLNDWHTHEDIELYYGNNCSSKKPLLNAPEVVKVRINEDWYVTDNLQIRDAAEEFFQQLHILSEILGTYTEAQEKQAKQKEVASPTPQPSLPPTNVWPKNKPIVMTLPINKYPRGN